MGPQRLQQPDLSRGCTRGRGSCAGTLDPSEEGGYAFEDGVATLTTDVGSFYCPDAEIGIYEVVFESQDEMAWTVVSDECIGRIDTFDEETFLRYMP